jgi:hypothetical protein
MHPTPQGVVLAPVSPAVAALLHELQAQIIREADEACAPSGAITLSEATGERKVKHRVGYAGCSQYVEVESKGFHNSVGHAHVPKAGREEYWKGAAIWNGTEHRTDSHGNTWWRYYPDMVTDDFGSLVPVEGGAA